MERSHECVNCHVRDKMSKLYNILEHKENESSIHAKLSIICQECSIFYYHNNVCDCVQSSLKPPPNGAIDKTQGVKAGKCFGNTDNIL